VFIGVFMKYEKISAQKRQKVKNKIGGTVMRKILALTLLVGLGVLLVSSADAARRKRAPEGVTAAAPVATVEAKPSLAVLSIADFDSGTKPNDIGGDYGAWDKDPNDDTQGCKESFYSPGRTGKGKCIRLIYDVDSPSPAYNGFWMKLMGCDLRPYNKLVFWIKGDKEAGYTTKLKVELKNSTEVSPYYIDSITEEWQKIELPLKSFKRISDWSKMKEFVLVFEDNQATARSGIIYLDDISFEK